VLTVTSSMYGRDPTPILPPTQHLCMQPTSTTHSHPPNGMSANFKIVFPKYSPQSHQQGRSRLDGVPSVYHNLGALPIIASVSLTPIPCLFACFCESVSCEYAFFSTCFWYLCCERCVVGVRFCIHNHFFCSPSYFYVNSIDTFGTVLLMYA